MIIIDLLIMIEMLMSTEAVTRPTEITEWSIVDDTTVTQHHSTVDEAGEQPYLVQHNHHAVACRKQAGQHVCENPLMLQVNARGRLIQHQEIWLSSQRPSDQYALLLSSRKTRNVGVELVRQPNEGNGVMYGRLVNSAQWPEEPSACQAASGNNLFDLRSTEQGQ
jgi:hypothetical protein